MNIKQKIEEIKEQILANYPQTKLNKSLLDKLKKDLALHKDIEVYLSFAPRRDFVKSQIHGLTKKIESIDEMVRTNRCTKKEAKEIRSSYKYEKLVWQKQVLEEVHKYMA